jgi:putative phosphoribosyl transferase
MVVSETVQVPVGGPVLPGDLEMPETARGVVLFAHGSGSSRFSPRNRAVADALRQAGLGTLLLDLLTGEEEHVDVVTAEHRFDIGLLGGRLTAAVDRLTAHPATAGLPVHLFGASTGAAAALVAAAGRPDQVRSVVSRGGRPDLAGDALEQVRAPVLLIVGGRDQQVLRMNEAAAQRLRAPYEVRVVAGATHLFEEPGALEEVAALAGDWFLRPAHQKPTYQKPAHRNPGRRKEDAP